MATYRCWPCRVGAVAAIGNRDVQSWGALVSGTQPNAARKRPMVTLTLSPEAIARLDKIATARGQSRSAVVEQLIRKEPPR